MTQTHKHEIDTANIILYCIAHYRGQVNKTEARSRPNARGRGQLVEAKAEAEAKRLASRPVWPPDLSISITGS